MKKLIIVILLLIVSGCCFSRSLKVTAKGADAAVYGSLDTALVENYWCASLFKGCK